MATTDFPKQRLVAITGGIGSGKSVVARIVSTMGYAVYDSDAEAKRIMDKSPAIKKKLITEFGEKAVVGSQINRKYIADIVFNDPLALNRLNEIVHPEVIADLVRWKAGKVAFVETAIPYQSGIDKLVDQIWEVTAPTRIRIERVMRRSNLTCSEVSERIRAQSVAIVPTHPHEFRIINDDVTPLLPQVMELLKGL